MTDLRLEKIRFKNFKVFDDFTIDFNNDDLLVFGGPNGYGKTTIFDGIELALTGNIGRFQSIESNTGCKDIIVAKVQKKDIEIELTLSRGNEKITIIRRNHAESSDKSYSKNEKKTGNFSNLWKLYWTAKDEKKKKISQKILEEEIGQDELSRYFNLFYYIQQEDTAHFLRKSEKDRLTEIARLFGTSKEDGELKKLNTAKTKIKNLKLEYEKNIKIIEESLPEEERGLVGSQIVFSRLLHWTEPIKEWDKEKLTFATPETKNKYTKELLKIKALINHGKEFLNHKKFLDISGQTETIKAVLIGAKFFDKFEQVRDRYEDKKKLEVAFKILEKDEVIPSCEKLDTGFLSRIFPQFDMSTFINALAGLKQQRSSLISSKEILRSLIEIRSNFSKKFTEIEHPDIEKEKCPFCGYDWKKAETLLEQIKEKTVLFKEMLSEEENSYQSKEKEFRNDLLKPLREKIEKELEMSHYIISDNFFSKLNEAQKLKDKSNNLIRWLKEKDVQFSDLWVTGLDEDIDDLEDRSKKLVERIMRLAPAQSGEYQAKDNEIKFKEIFTAFFNDNPKKLMELVPTDIDKKLGYIENQYFQSEEKKRAELETLKSKIENLNQIDSDLKTTIDTYKEQIGLYRKNLIQSIEIPFFIYCGKILQTIRDEHTSGVFIKDPSKGDELKNIRFVTDINSDHDVINTTSSGQLAGIVIALTLAMNRIYSTGLASIFIDDPVQSMDDLNMISLVELLRNDFADKQIFLSTHEREIENYILYKYIKYGRAVGRVNCMTREVYHNH